MAAVVSIAIQSAYANNNDQIVAPQEELELFSCPAHLGNFGPMIEIGIIEKNALEKLENICEDKSADGQKLTYKINKSKSHGCKNGLIKSVFECVPKKCNCECSTND